MKRRSVNKRQARGFTLIEAMIAMVIIGLTIAAIIASSAAFTQSTGAGIDLSTAEFLMEQIRELTAPLPVIDPELGTTTFGPEGEALADYDDVDDFDGASYSPPIDINRATLNDFAAFGQQVTVENVDINDLTSVVGDHTSDFVRITVDITLNGQVISSCSWVRARL